MTGNLLQELIGANIRMILEIGAHHGTHTAMFLECFPVATVHCFEPDPRAVERHRKNIRDARVSLHERAIGAVNGRAEFHMSGGLPPGAPPSVQANYPKGWDQSGSLRAPKKHVQKFPWCKFVRVVKVPVSTLDSWTEMNGIDQIDLIWADMQGAEGDLATSGSTALMRTRYLFCEYSNEELYEGEPTLEALLDMMPGFEVLRRFPFDVLLRNTTLVPA